MSIQYKCPQCSYRLYSRSDLVTHLRMFHAGRIAKRDDDDDAILAQHGVDDISKLIVDTDLTTDPGFSADDVIDPDFKGGGGESSGGGASSDW